MAGSWSGTTPSPPRIRGRQLQRLRARLFARQPWCALCPKRGTHNRSTIRDHTIPLAEGGRDDATNEQGICADCNRLKTAEESARGVRRR
jgi:5-methylcytosine-specific restriction enzyme A